MSRTKQPCGCVHDGQRWLTLCAPHQAETAALRAGARVDYWSGQRPDPERVRGCCVVCGGPAPAAARCTNGRCAGCHVTHCTPGGATSPGHNPIGFDVDGRPLGVRP